MKRSHMLNIIALILIIVGMTILFLGALVRHTNASIQSQPPITAQNSEQPKATSVIHGNPIELRIDDLGIKNEVIPGVFEARTQQWTLTTDKAQFAVMTHQPNDKGGLTFVYGHNRKEVFARLTKIQPGTLVTVTTDNNYLFTYRFTGSQTVKPEDVSVFAYEGPPKLVLQTCTGLFYQNRQLFSFEFVGVTNA